VTEGLAYEPGLDTGRDPVLADLGERMRLARLRAGMTQEDLGDKLGVTQTAVSYWEGGKRDPGVAELLRIAEAIGVPASRLLPPEHLGRPAPEPPVPAGRWGRIEIPGYRENEGWITEETRFGLQVAVVRDRDGTETAAIGIGPLCRVVWLPAPDPEPRLALPAGEGFGYELGEGDYDDEDDGDD
jgi:transcriptional regulator with XRE-family HTH domain